MCTTANYVNLLFPEAQPCVCIAINLIKSIMVCIKWLPNIRLNTFILIVYFPFYAKTSPSSLFIPIQNDFNQEKNSSFFFLNSNWKRSKLDKVFCENIWFVSIKSLIFWIKHQRRPQTKHTADASNNVTAMSFSKKTEKIHFAVNNNFFRMRTNVKTDWIINFLFLPWIFKATTDSFVGFRIQT